MANLSTNKAKSKDLPRTPLNRQHPQDIHDHPPESTVNGKRKKKKKGKGKSTAGGGNVTNPPQDDEDDEDELPNLEPATPFPTAPPHLHPSYHSQKQLSRTGLSPDLQSVHISTTASLAAPIGTPTELMNTAHDLYRHIDSESMAIPEDSDYWTTLPPNIRSFVQNVYAQGALTGGTDPERAQAMYSIAQQMIASNQSIPTRVSHGGNQALRNGSSPYPPGAYPSFDASIFSDPAFTQALEQLIPPQHAGRFTTSVPPAPGQPPQGPLPQPTNVVLLNDFGPDGQQYDEDYYSEDEDDVDAEDVEEGEAQHTTSAQSIPSYDINGRPQSTPTYTHHQRITIPIRATAPASRPPALLQEVNGAAAKKKNKKKKKKASTGPPNPSLPISTPVSNPPPPTRDSVPIPIQSSAPQQHPPARPAPMLHTPSSRAAGKQPMAYPPTNTAPHPNPSSLAPPPRTSRAASKAPATGTGHYHHGHHHPSPPSSNASAPNKPRPPAANSSTAAKQSSNLWYTNSTEERERIKEFWLGLSEDERRDLVKVEKEAVLRKMKDQQRHGCSCAVCGRKR